MEYKLKLQPIVLCHMILYDIEHYYMVVFFYWYLWETDFLLKVVANEIKEMLFAFDIVWKDNEKMVFQKQFEISSYFFSRSWKRSHVKVPNYFFNSNALFYCVLLVHCWPVGIWFVLSLSRAVVSSVELLLWCWLHDELFTTTAIFQLVQTFYNQSKHIEKS